MADYAIWNFPNHKKDTTINAIQFTIDVEGTPKDLTGCSIVMGVRNQKFGQAIEYSTDNNKLEITDAANGVFIFKEQVIDLKVGNYAYDINITFPNGSVKSWIGGSWNIVENVIV